MFDVNLGKQAKSSIKCLKFGLINYIDIIYIITTHKL